MLTPCKLFVRWHDQHGDLHFSQELDPVLNYSQEALVDISSHESFIHKLFNHLSSRGSTNPPLPLLGSSHWHMNVATEHSEHSQIHRNKYTSGDAKTLAASSQIPTQGSTSHLLLLLHCRWILYHWCHLGGKYFTRA